MGVEFVERFFRLTLDNVYRFACSLMFAVALVAITNQTLPLTQLAGLLDWLAVPSSWLVPVSDWLAERQVVVDWVAFLTLIVAVTFSLANDWRSRSGSTALLATAILFQGEFGWRTFAAAIICLVALMLVTGLAHALTSRLGIATPGWTRSAWSKVGNAVMTLAFAVLYLLSPLGWLISQEPHNSRGTRWNPLYIEQVERSVPSGAISPR
ncbi:hypothetical protein [Glutamicibacter sp. PS]|uniref:hypothetical protein n=1 Tax=Glutamicibacter sp. PS TaxID=3075634 RepID=UPI0028499653|nr:hypothetical protein [Glutamicibacter sp. PS]MDR4534091.1 hypothetical protein [Glutamicibacter sp. PS]